MRLLHRTAVVTLVMAGLGLVSPSVASAQDRAPHVPVAAPQRVTAADLQVDTSRSNAPWRVEVLSDGSRNVIFGGINRVPMSPKTVKYATGVPAGSVVSPNASGYCNGHDREFQTVRDGSYLRGPYYVTCSGITSQRIRWQFMRSSWSGFRNYTDLVTGGWVSSLTISGNLSAYCFGGGTYDYKLRYYSDVIYNGQTLNGPYAENTITRTACGTGVS